VPLKATGFSKSFRLSKASDYQYVFDSAYRSVDSSFLVLARNNARRIPRLGLAISKKNLGLAVKRNSIKRLVRESFRRRQQDLAGMDIVVLSQKRIHKTSNRDLRKSLKLHWDKIIKCAQS